MSGIGPPLHCPGSAPGPAPPSSKADIDPNKPGCGPETSLATATVIRFPVTPISSALPLEAHAGALGPPGFCGPPGVIGPPVPEGPTVGTGPVALGSGRPVVGFTP